MADQVKIRATANITKDFGALPDGTYALDQSITLSLADADKIYAESFSIAASGNEGIDLESVTDPFGAAIDFATVTHVLIGHDEDSAASSVALSGNFLDTALGATVDADIEDGDGFFYSNATGITVTNSSSDTITITNNDAVNAATVWVVIAGTTA
jgi:hypothetical protein